MIRVKETLDISQTKQCFGIKCEIRGATISYSAYIAKRRREQEHFLSRQLQFLEENLDNGNLAIFNEYNLMKSEIENINDVKAKGVLFRLKA